MFLLLENFGFFLEKVKGLLSGFCEYNSLHFSLYPFAVAVRNLKFEKVNGESSAQENEECFWR